MRKMREWNEGAALLYLSQTWISFLIFHLVLRCISHDIKAKQKDKAPNFNNNGKMCRNTSSTKVVGNLEIDGSSRTHNVTSVC